MSYFFELSCCLLIAQLLNTVSSVAQLLSAVQQAAAELRKSLRVAHAFNGITPRKQADINAPGSGMISRVARPKTERKRRQLLAKAKRVIRQRYSEFDLGLADIAAEVGCSTRQLQRVFREIDETDFRSYLLSVRMERARQLLSRKRGGLTVRQAAQRVGYQESSGLRPRFQRYFGVNPSEVQAPPPDYDEFWKASERAQDA